MSAEMVLVDTGFLLALHSSVDPHHGEAVAWLKTYRGGFLTVEAVIVETTYFLRQAQRAALVSALSSSELIAVRTPDAEGYKRISNLLMKYAGLEADYTDCGIVWLAEKTGVRRILTLDVNDFSVYRLNGRKKFELVQWMRGR